jgi:hypothetical protein
MTGRQLPPGHFRPAFASVCVTRKQWCAVSFQRWYPGVRLALRQEHLRPCLTATGTTWQRAFKVIEPVGTADSWEKAAAAAVNRASKSLRDLRVAEVVQLDMQLDAKGKIKAYRAKLKVSFKFEG